MSSIDCSITPRAQLTCGVHHRIKPLFHENGLYLTLTSRVRAPSTLPNSRVLTVHLPNTIHYMQPHHTPPELDSVATRRPLNLLNHSLLQLSSFGSGITNALYYSIQHPESER